MHFVSDMETESPCCLILFTLKVRRQRLQRGGWQ